MIYLDRDGADACVQTINSQIEVLREAASQINAAMSNLEGCWKGASADKAQNTYESDYKQMLTEQIPSAVDDFKQFMNSCVQAIYDTDLQLSGN